MEEYFEGEFLMEMKDFFLEKAITIKQWIFLGYKLVDNIMQNLSFISSVLAILKHNYFVLSFKCYTIHH